MANNTITHTHQSTSIVAPKRFASQVALAAYAADLNDDQFSAFADLLVTRRWTVEEFATRIYPLRPEASVWSEDRFEPVVKAVS